MGEHQSQGGAPIARRQWTRRNLRLSYLDSAPVDRARPVVLFIHGFPDTASMWAPTIAAMHAQGYRCIAPDTVGCGESDTAARCSDYNVRHLIGDLAGLLDHLGVDQVDVVGHDWGALQAWLLAAWHPRRVRRLAVLSVGHPMAYARAGFDQKRAGWYVAFFQLAGLSERLLLGAGRFSLRCVFASHPEMDEVMQRLSSPGRLTAALRIYRANLVDVLLRKHPAVVAPTLALWSEGDRFLVESQMRDSHAYVDAPFTYRRIGGSHWIPLSHPAWITEQLLGHFNRSPKTPS